MFGTFTAVYRRGVTDNIRLLDHATKIMTGTINSILKEGVEEIFSLEKLITFLFKKKFIKFTINYEFICTYQQIRFYINFKYYANDILYYILG